MDWKASLPWPHPEFTMVSEKNIEWRTKPPEHKTEEHKTEEETELLFFTMSQGGQRHISGLAFRKRN